MLQIAADVPIREQGLASLLRRDMDWFEILTRLFAAHMREQWQRGVRRSRQAVANTHSLRLREVFFSWWKPSRRRGSTPWIMSA
jgi:hypothetical protein